jgi:hypothetical protein
LPAFFLFEWRRWSKPHGVVNHLVVPFSSTRRFFDGPSP